MGIVGVETVEFGQRIVAKITDWGPIFEVGQ